MNSRTRVLTVGTLLLAATLLLEPAQAAGKPIAAVFPIKVARVRLKADVLDALWETLTAKLTEAGAYQVVPKDTLKKKLRAQKKKSYKRCYAKSCQLSIGQELAANKAIATTILRLGKQCRVTIKVWDLRKAAAEKAGTGKGRCNETGLVKAVETAAAKLTGTWVAPLAPGLSGGMKAKPLPRSGGARRSGGTSAGRCPAGMEVVSGHCCWPGQDWGAGSRKCIGVPKCPNGFVAAGTRACRPGCKTKGKVLVAGHCCWPGQDWGSRAQKCLGKPTRCPSGMKAWAGGCGLPSKAGEKWVSLPAGSFMMGSATSKEVDEKPVHRVTLKAFAMLKTEVTVGQYRACVNAGSCTKPTPQDSSDSYKKYYNWGSSRGDSHPINGVDWKQAKAFCAWIGGRLPSEAEWEYAARSAGKRQTYPWGNQTADCSRAVMKGNGNDGCGRDSTWPVCSKAAGNTAQGLCDMAGNVWEWVADCYQDSYTGARTTNAPRNNCAGKYASHRVIRGGSWFYVASFLRAASRSRFTPSYRDFNLGFRCAGVQPQESKPKEATTPNLAELDPDLLLTVMGDRPDEASLLPVRQRRLDWATLLRRVFAVDLTVCPRCTGAMRVLCAINDPPVAQKILRHLGLPTEGPRCAPARGPPEPEFDFDIDQDTEPWGDDDGLELDVEDENLEA
jgi:formylglycine-generating enzyme required for sulfatase activity